MKALISVAHKNNLTIEHSSLSEHVKLIRELERLNVSYEIKNGMPGWLYQHQDWVEFEAKIEVSKRANGVYSLKIIDPVLVVINPFSSYLFSQVSLYDESNNLIPFTFEKYIELGGSVV